MYGLFGAISADEGRDGLENRVENMHRALRANAKNIHNMYISESAAMFVEGPLNNKEVSSLYESEKATFAFWGYVWNQGELAAKLDRGLYGSNPSIAELISLLMEQFNEDVILNFNGRFVIAVWNKLKKELTLLNDRFGFCPMYYWSARNKFLFGSQYKAISAEADFSKEIDLQALGDFLSLGYSTGERTLFKHIRLLPPASIATVRPGEALSIRPYWDYSFHSDEDPVLTEREYEKGFFSRLNQALMKQAEYADRVLIPVSGGYDSRVLTGMLSRMKKTDDLIALSYGHDYALDVIYGRKIAKKCGIKHYTVPIEDDYLCRYAERFVWMLEGTVSCLNAHMLTTFDVIENENIDTVMTGFFGDIVAGSGTWIYSVGVLGNSNDEEIFQKQYDIHCDIMTEMDIEKYLKSDICRAVNHSAKKALWDRYNKSTTKNRYFKSRYFSMHERQRRYTSFNLYVFDHKNVMAPFVDNDFVDYVLHIPSTLLINQHIYTNVMTHHLPGLASVPYNETRLPINASRWRKGIQWRWEKLNKNRLFQETLGVKWRKMNDNYIQSANAIRNGSKEYVIDIIKSSPIICDYFNINEVSRMIDNHLNEKTNDQMKILSLLTIALWHKMFIESDYCR